MDIRVKESMKGLSILWLSVILIISFADSTLAQEIRGSISGKISDPQGSAVVGATVTIIQVDTNVSQTSTTNDEGRYTAAYLNPGIYSITVEATGYKKVVRGNIELRVEDRLELNLKLEIGSINEIVNVTDTAPLIETNDASMGQIIDQRLITELPTPDGNTYILTRLGPGIVDNSDPEFTRPHDLMNTTKQSSNGISNSNEYTVDNAPNSGLNNRDGLTTRPAFIPSADSVQEFKVNTFSTDASFGRAAGATINVATKSGKNTPFGSLYYFLRNDKLSANKFFANRSGQERPILRYNRFGATLGGPIFLPRFWGTDVGEGGPALYDGRNRSFFFFAFEGLYDSMPNAGYFTVPSLAQRRGDFSALLGDTLVPNTVKLSKDIPRDSKTGCGGGKKDTIIPLFHYDGTPAYKGQIYDPSTAKVFTKCNPVTGKLETRVERLPFAGNIIPQNRFNSISRAFFNYFPLPNVEGNSDGKNNFYSPNSENTKYRNNTLRLDHSYNESHKAFVRFTHTFRDNDRRPWTGVVNGIMPSGEKWDRGSLSLLYDHIYIISPATVLNVRVDGTYAADSFTVPSKGLFNLGMVGFSPQALATLPTSDYFPTLSVSGYTGLGGALPDAANSRVYSTQVKLHKSIGNHQFVFGYDLRYYNQTDTPEENAAGSYSFSDAFVKGPFSNSSGVTGQSFAGFLLGLASGSVDRKPGAKTQQTFQSFFVQDNWKVHGRLTLNLGLRYEYEGAVREKYNRAVRGFDPNLIIDPTLEQKAAEKYATFYNSLDHTKNPFYEGLVTPEKVASAMRGGYVFADENHQALWDPVKTHLMPRIGAAFQLNKKTVLRGGLSFTNAPIGVGGVSQVGFAQTTRIVNSASDGIYGCSTCGTFDNPFPLGIIDMPARPVLTRFVGREYGNVRPIGTRRTFKYVSWSFGIQRQLPGRWMIEAAYVGNRSTGRLVWRNINAVPAKYYSTSPYRDTSMEQIKSALDAEVPNPFYKLFGNDNDTSLNTKEKLTLERLLRPNPFFEDINLPFYDGLTYYHSGQFRLQKRFSDNFSGFLTYTWAKSMQQNSLRNEFDTEYEKVISGGDVPHRFTAAGVFDLPFGKRRRWGTDMPKIVDAILGGWQLGSTYVWQKGTPIGLGNIVFLGDFSTLRTKIDSKSVVSTSGEKKLQGKVPSNVFNNIFGVDLRTSGFYFTDDLVRDPLTGELDFRRQREDDRIELTKNIKTLPSRVTWLRGQPRKNMDFSLMKRFYIREKTHLQLRCEMINAMNTVLFDDITMDPKKADFGTVNNQRNPARYFQLGLRIAF